MNLLLAICSLLLSACHQSVVFSTKNTVQKNETAQQNTKQQIANQALRAKVQSRSEKPLMTASESGNVTEDIQQSQSLKPDSNLPGALKPLDFKAIYSECQNKLKNIEFKTGTEGWSSLNERPPSSNNGEQILALYPISAEGQVEQVLSFFKSGKLQYLDLLSGTYYPLFDVPEKYDRFAVSPDFCFVAIGGRDLVQVFELGSGAMIAQTNRIVGVISALEFQPNGSSLLIGAANTNIFRWHFLPRERKSLLEKNKKELERYIAHPNVVSALAYHPGGRVFFSGDWSGVLNAWENYDVDSFQGAFDYREDRRSTFVDKAERSKSALSPNDAVEHIVVSDDGLLLVVGFQSGKIAILKIRGLKPILFQQVHKGALLGFDISPDNKKLVTVGRDGFLRTWSIKLEEDRSKILRQQVMVAEKLDELEANDIKVVRFVGESSFIAGVETGEVYSISFKQQTDKESGADE